MKKILASALTAFILCFSLLSCTEIPPEINSRVFFNFDTVGTFYDYSGMGYRDFSKLADSVEEELSEYHRLYDIYNEYEGINNIATLNKSAGKGAVKVDRKIIDLLLFAKEMHELTDGNINVAMGSVLSIWHDYREAGVSLPYPEELSEAAKHTNIQDVIIDEENLTVEIKDPKLRLDVGAVGKGYAAEMVALRLHGEGYNSLVLDVGGNIRVIGAKPSGEEFSVGVTNPYSDYDYLYEFSLSNGAAVTSGSYERYYTVGGKNYHHIINKDTLMPADYYISVSVKSPSSALSDALSTAIFNMDFGTASAFVKSQNGLEVVFLLKSGETKIVKSGK